MSHRECHWRDDRCDDRCDDRRAVATARRIVIKLGTSVVTRDDGALALARLYALVESIAALRRAGREVVLVSSGAIGLGVQRLGLGERPRSLPLKQACAAVGQGRLMALYAEAFDRCGVVSAQVLLTEEDIAAPERYHNVRATLTTLLEIGAVPIVNENDTVSTVELERMAETAGVDGAPVRRPVFGDNDQLSALIATKIGAEVLVLLSDVDGLMTANPFACADATLISVVDCAAEVLPGVTSGGGRGRGGMATKVEAARLAAAAGMSVVIANGQTPGVIDRICAGERMGTLFLPEGEVTV